MHVSGRSYLSSPPASARESEFSDDHVLGDGVMTSGNKEFIFLYVENSLST